MNHFYLLRRISASCLVLLVALLLSLSPLKLGAQDPNNFLAAEDGDPQRAVFVDGDGKVGIGTEAPEASLQVAGGQAESSVLFSHLAFQPPRHFPDPGGFFDVKFKLSASSTMATPHFTLSAETPNMPIILKGNGGALHILTSADPSNLPLTGGSFGLALGIKSLSEYKWIQSFDGPLSLNPQGNNVGIGTATPQAKLTVAGEIFVVNAADNTPDVEILGGGGDGFMTLNDGGQPRLIFAARNPGSTGAGGLIKVQNSAGMSTVEINGDTGDGSGRITTSVLEITGGSDLAELFDITDADFIEPGMVVAIDPDHPGQLRLTHHSYDRMVAGVISGAGGIDPGLILQQQDSDVTGNQAVALTGRVYVWADALHGAIQPGDLLTTSDTPGYAMKVTDYEQAQGAILGKAMSKLEEGKGLVLVLVTLQ